MKGDYPAYRKSSFSQADLIEQFTLTPPELAFISKFRGNTNRHSVAVMLKTLQHLGYFPDHPNLVPEQVKDFIGQQLGLLLDFTTEYENASSTRGFHLAEIRELTGFRFATAADKDELHSWLIYVAGYTAFTEEDLAEDAYSRLKDLKIELPAEKEFGRLVSSALVKFFENLYATITSSLSSGAKQVIDDLLLVPENDPVSKFDRLKDDPGKPGLKTLKIELSKLHTLRDAHIMNFPRVVSHKLLEMLTRRAKNEEATRMRDHEPGIRYALMASFISLRSLQVTDDIVKLLVELIHKIDVRAEKQMDKRLLAEIKKVRGKMRILSNVSRAALDSPDGIVREVIYPQANEDILRRILREIEYFGPQHKQIHRVIMRDKYSSHYRQMVPLVLGNISFRCSNRFQPLIEALTVIRRDFSSKATFFHEEVPIQGVVTPKWAPLVFENSDEGNIRINRRYYELCVLQGLERALKCKEIWVEGSYQYRDPAADLPSDWDVSEKRQAYYEKLNQPIEVKSFLDPLKKQLHQALTNLDRSIAQTEKVKIILPPNSKKRGYFAVEKNPRQSEPRNLELIREAISNRYGMVDLLEIFEVADRLVDFTGHFTHSGIKEMRSRQELRPLIILDLFAEGTNIGIKRVAKANRVYDYKQLLYVRKNYFSPEALRSAITAVVNEVLRRRNPAIWGEGNVCASDGKRFGAWNHNLNTEWRTKYKGYGIVVYWHVGTNAVCIYSQLKNFSFSEVAAMIEGLIRHETQAKIDRNYVDSRGQSEVAFAFSKLLNRFRLMPRLKGIKRERLYLPEKGCGSQYPNLHGVLHRCIHWQVIEQQYDEMMKLTTAILSGTGSTEAILRRFNSYNRIHPTYKALAELGKVEKTVFLCEYLSSPALRMEIHEGLNVVENWNATTEFIHYAREGEFATNSRENQEIAALSLHLLQNCMILINTLLIERVLEDAEIFAKLTKEDFRALTPLIHGHVNPFGHFILDVNKPSFLEAA